MGRVVVNHDSHLWKGIGDVMVELHRVVHRGLIVKRHAEQQTLRARFLGESRLSHRFARVQVRAADEHGYALLHSRDRRLDQLLMLLPKQCVKLAEAAGGRDDVGAAVANNLIHGAR